PPPPSAPTPAPPPPPSPASSPSPSPTTPTAGQSPERTSPPPTLPATGIRSTPGRENELEQLSTHVLRPNLPQDGHRTAFPAPNQRPTPRNPIVQESPSWLRPGESAGAAQPRALTNSSMSA